MKKPSKITSINTTLTQLAWVAKIPCLVEYTKNYKIIRSGKIQNLLSTENLNIFENYAMKLR